ncbi:MAG TPA: sporulation integral membrane protein YtvI [Firmicutes bacterium]|nr:sporulation integral membrane protein YtvI [Bacillota bacterium]
MQKVSEGWRYFLIWSAVLATCYLVARYVLSLFTPFIAAFLLAAIIDPVVELLTRRYRFRRGVCTSVCLMLVFVLLSVVIALVVVRIIAEVQDLYRALPLYNMNLEEILGKVVLQIRNVAEDLPDSVIEAVRRMQSRLYAGVEGLLLGVTGVIMSLPRLSINVIISFFAAFFISRDKKELSGYVANLAPVKWRERATKARAGLISALLGFIRAYLILISITIIVSIVGFTVANIRYAWILGIIAGILDLIPLVGPGLLYVPLIIFYLVVRQFHQAIVIAVLMAIQFFVRKGLEPKVLGSNLGIHPLWVLVSMYLGYRLLGAVGMFIGPLIAVILRVMVTVGILPSWPKE